MTSPWNLDSVSLIFCFALKVFFFFLRFYLFIHKRLRERKRQRNRQREKQDPRREPDAELDPGTTRSCPEPKADAQPLSHPGVPAVMFLLALN